MKRRELLAFLALSPFLGNPAEAQQAGKVWRIGVLMPGAPPEPLVDAIKEGLRGLGRIEGRDYVFEIRWAEGKLDRLGALAAELVAAKVDLITSLSTPGALAAKGATATIPIVFTGVGDPVGTGVVGSLAHPGGNVTGLSILATELAGKRLEILREIAPGGTAVAMLWNDTNPGMVLRAREATDAGKRLGLGIRSIGVHDLVSFEAAFTEIRGGHLSAMLTLVDPFTRENRRQIVELAAKLRLPAIYESSEFPEAGGLISYGPSLPALQRRSATYIDRIFKGEKPGDLPIELPSVFEMVVNMKAAKALGMTIPNSVLLRADKVIE